MVPCHRVISASDSIQRTVHLRKRAAGGWATDDPIRGDSYSYAQEFFFNVPASHMAMGGEKRSITIALQTPKETEV